MAPDAGKSVNRADPFAPLTSDMLDVGDLRLDVILECVPASNSCHGQRMSAFVVDVPRASLDP